MIIVCKMIIDVFKKAIPAALHVRFLMLTTRGKIFRYNLKKIH